MSILLENLVALTTSTTSSIATIRAHLQDQAQLDPEE